MMEVSWDERKRLENLRVHKYDFQDAWKIFNGLEFAFEDHRFPYPERRYNTLGFVNGRVAKLTYCYEARLFVSYPFEKPQREKPANTTASYVSETDWEAVDAMDDADIVLDGDCPETQPDDFERGTLLFNGRAPTQGEIEEGKRILLNYLKRTSKHSDPGES